MNAGEALGQDPAPLALTFADALQQWGKAVPLSRTGSSFSIAVSLFADVASGVGNASRPVPLLTIDRIDLMTPPGWPLRCDVFRLRKAPNADRSIIWAAR